ncbi:MAG: hypothetical protein SH809_00370 [Rhodothermales bacterium]|nr:hypothetical protein [Rhodothermales bacterium]
MNPSNTPEIARNLIMTTIWDTLSFQELTQVQAGVDRPFIQVHLEKSWRSERLRYAILIGSLVFTAILVVTWGLQFGWTSIWSYLMAGAYLIGPYTAAMAYAEAKRTRAAWEMAETLYTSNSSVPPDISVIDKDLAFQLVAE